jgi:hypothetical protein
LNKVKTIFFVKLFLLFSITIQFAYSQQSQSTELYEWLKSIEGIEVKTLEPDSVYSEVYEIMVTQPVDHFSHDSKTFKQQIFISHVDKQGPMVIDMDGYSVNNRKLELSRILRANQLVVEHRYFGESMPDSLEWQYMTVRQAAADHHRIIELFKQFYTGKWISTGISKGGQTAMIHRRFYPNDVDVTVPYVAPLNFSAEDKRVDEFLKNVSTQECRDRVKEFQRLALKKRNEILPLFKKEIEEKSFTYNFVGEAAFEYVVLEYGFAYWQWSSGDCSLIPDSTAEIDSIFEHLKSNSPFSYFSDEDITNFAPFFYQAYTEMGYYAYDIEPFEDLLKYANGKTPFFIPKNVSVSFDPEVMKDINHFIQCEADNFIFIYGENDPWTATSVCLSGRTNSIKMVHPGGSHRTRIRHFSNEEKEIIYSKLEEWLGIKIGRNF